MVRKTLFVCGILASLLYVAMTLFVGMLWDGYSSAAQTIGRHATRRQRIWRHQVRMR